MSPTDFKIRTQQFRRHFRPLERLNRIVRVCTVVTLSLSGMLQGLASGSGTNPGVGTYPAYSGSMMSALYVVQVIGLIGYVAYCLWLWRAARNRHLLSDVRRAYFDAILLICCFLPGLNFFLTPYFFSVLYNESQPSTENTSGFRMQNFIGKRVLIIVLAFAGLIAFQVALATMVFGSGGTGNPAQFYELLQTYQPAMFFAVGVMCWAWISMVNKITELQHAEFERQETPCPSCGEPLAETVESCPLCGHDLKIETSSDENEDLPE